MKKNIILLLTMFFLYTGVNGQILLKNAISANFGMGLSGSSHTMHAFGLGYQREISKALFVQLEYSNIQGSQSFKSIFGEVPKVNEYAEFGEGFQVYNGNEESIFGRMIQVSNWSLGLKKYIQLGPKLLMAGSISVVTNSISRIEIEGLIYNNNNTVNYDDARPTYGTYNKLSGKVGFELLYNLKESIYMVSKIEYVSFESIILFSLGTTVSF